MSVTSLLTSETDTAVPQQVTGHRTVITRPHTRSRTGVKSFMMCQRREAMRVALVLGISVGACASDSPDLAAAQATLRECEEK
ncbi:MAG: hypothetical protein ABI614_25845 [Planctomycetota bacterium]